jgi:hypothetical protein
MEYGENRPGGSCANCSVRTIQALELKVGMKIGPSSIVAGFAGGVGLCGNVCGALASCVYTMSTTQQLGRKRKKRDSRIRGSVEELFGTNYRGNLTRLRKAFAEQFGSELCADIIGRHFQDAEDHAMFMEQGACDNVINFVANWVSKHSTSNKTGA